MRACVFAAVLLGIVAPARADYGPVERFQLENGLDVVLQANGAPFVAAYVLYRAGSADDPPGYSGLA
ncbi:MAG: insulinase family protein, partial [Myxococcota bacterium]